MFDLLIRALLIGVGATVIFDLWSILLNRTLGYALPNWAMVGRWVLHLPGGRFAHESIAAAPSFPNELTAGWIFHYFVGFSFALALLLIWPGWTANPTLLPALIVGWVTVGCGWFILAPAVGNGVAHCKKADANKSRLLNIIAHTVFGAGMWVTGLLLKAVI